LIHKVQKREISKTCRSIVIPKITAKQKMAKVRLPGNCQNKAYPKPQAHFFFILLLAPNELIDCHWFGLGLLEFGQAVLAPLELFWWRGSTKNCMKGLLVWLADAW